MSDVRRPGRTRETRPNDGEKQETDAFAFLSTPACVCVRFFTLLLSRLCCCIRYKLILGADYAGKEGKTLLVAYHQLLATRSVYSIYTGSERRAVDRLGQLESSPFGTSFELFDSHERGKGQGALGGARRGGHGGGRGGGVRRTRSGSIQYTFNMLGGRGPRSVEVKLPASEPAPEAAKRAI